jgi:hypothetical protein
MTASPSALQLCFITHPDISPYDTYTSKTYSSSLHQTSSCRTTIETNYNNNSTFAHTHRLTLQFNTPQLNTQLQWPSSATSSTCRLKTFLHARAHHQPALCLKSLVKRNRRLHLNLLYVCPFRIHIGFSAVLRHRYPPSALLLEYPFAT